jgi:hypothetical protein
VAVVGKNSSMRSSSCTALAISASGIGLIAPEQGNEPSLSRRRDRHPGIGDGASRATKSPSGTSSRSAMECGGVDSARDRRFESCSLQQRVREPSVPQRRITVWTAPALLSEIERTPIHARHSPVKQAWNLNSVPVGQRFELVQRVNLVSADELQLPQRRHEIRRANAGSRPGLGG